MKRLFDYLLVVCVVFLALIVASLAHAGPKVGFGTSSGGGGGGTPGGSDTQVQFNDAGSFGGSAAFVLNKATGQLTLDTGLAASPATYRGMTIANPGGPILAMTNSGGGGSTWQWVGGIVTNDEVVIQRAGDHPHLYMTTTKFQVANTTGYKISSTNDATGTADVGIDRQGPGGLKVVDGSGNPGDAYTRTVITSGYTVAGLSAITAVTGMRAYVTDAVACTFMGALTGSGATVCPVFYNGSAWVGG